MSAWNSSTWCELALSKSMNFFFFFFQAEDGIRDVAVTGVQTCALPICRHLLLVAQDDGPAARRDARQGPLLAAIHRDEPGVLPDAFHRSLGHAPPRLHLLARPRCERSQPRVDDRRVPDRAVDPDLRGEPVAQPHARR